MIWDCFTYNGEKELLEIRCEEMSELEVTHILVESPWTFTGKRKELKYSTLPYNIKYYIFEDMPNNGDAWANEMAQRNHILTALIELGAKDDDLILISDVDEIIKKQVLLNYINTEGLTSFCVDTYRYYLNCLEGKQNWARAKAANFKYVKTRTPDEIRNNDNARQIMILLGWHFSFVGDLNFIYNKIESFSHEFNNEEFKSKLDFKYSNCQSLWGKIIGLLSNRRFILDIRNNIDKFKHLIK
jgi:beta-1,4-mannosyl-glycoprotein beta-1,4-N-acetylglucosaminyltransferase